MLRLICPASVLVASMICWSCIVTEGQAADDDRRPGLIGVAVKDGQATGIGYRYRHGDVFPPELIRSQFHDEGTPFPEVQIELVGYVEAAKEMRVDVYHAAGGVNRDHGTLYVDGRKIGQVGDDTVKVVIYPLTLSQGQHEVRWVLTGGTFQPNLLKFQDAESSKLLPMYFTSKQRKETGAAKATSIIKAKGHVDGWPPAPNSWTRVDPTP
jgi:hypothetical protein